MSRGINPFARFRKPETPESAARKDCASLLEIGEMGGAGFTVDILRDPELYLGHDGTRLLPGDDYDDYNDDADFQPW